MTCVNYQDTTEGTGDQEINVIGVSNPSQSMLKVGVQISSYFHLIYMCTTVTEAIVLDPFENITEDAMAATSSVKVNIS